MRDKQKLRDRRQEIVDKMMKAFSDNNMLEFNKLQEKCEKIDKKLRRTK